MIDAEKKAKVFGEEPDLLLTLQTLVVDAFVDGLVEGRLDVDSIRR